MRRTPRTISTLRTAVITVAATAAMVFGVSAVAHAAWNDSAPLGADSITTGSLGIDPEPLPAGTWTNGDDAFDPATDKLNPGTTLTYTVPDVSVTAIGANLEATFQKSVAGAVVPDTIKDHVTISLASTPTTIKGNESDANGKQTVAVKLTVTADSSLPSDEQTIDLTRLTTTLQNSYGGWTDTATLDAGSLRTAAPKPVGGSVAFDFQLAYDTDKTICLWLGDPDATIHWGDWQSADDGVVTAAVEGRNCHTYPTGSTAQAYVTVRGSFARIGSQDQTVGDVGALVGVNQWTDSIGTTSAAYAFFNAVNMTYINGMPNTVRDLSYAFANASTQTPQQFSVNIDTSNVTSMAHTFEGAGSIEWYSLAQWKTSQVKTMASMFRNATSLSAGNPIGWDTSNVTDMSSMFEGATQFNLDIRGWNTRSVTTMASMFKGATVFDQNLASWDVAHVTRMESMFEDATSFNQSLAGWDTSMVVSFSKMFKGATAFDQAIGTNTSTGAWATSAATNMSQMFQDAVAFNQDIGNWNTSRVNTMQNMFTGASSFNRNLSGWVVTQNPNHEPFNTGANAEWTSNTDWQPQWPGTKAAAKPSASPSTPSVEPTETPSSSPTAVTPDPAPTTPSDHATDSTGTDDTAIDETTDDATEDDDSTPVTDDPTQPATGADDSTPTPAPSSAATPSPAETARDEETN